MTFSRLHHVVCFSTLCLAFTLWSSVVTPAKPRAKALSKRAARVRPKSSNWFFAVSGDSRDCGDLVMPKIAWSIQNTNAQTPAAFYWHLGDLRGMFRIDCDYLKRTIPDYDCKTRPANQQVAQGLNGYLKFAWDDFINSQVKPFGTLPFILGIGNHELINRTRDDFKCKFQSWLTQTALAEEYRRDPKRGIKSQPGSTYFHFIKGGVDFIYLDNAESDYAFSPEQLAWLTEVLAADAKDKSVKTLIVGMHAPLPQSSERGHAMDQTCKGICTGLQAYDMLYRAQNLDGPLKNRKHVYIFASHSHFFRENIYDTPEHSGRVLPGWIIGTSGAEQYIRETEQIRYGYMQVEVRADGTIATAFKEVTRTTPPLATGTGAEQLTAFCFEQNKRAPVDQHQTNCDCGAIK